MVWDNLKYFKVKMILKFDYNHIFKKFKILKVRLYNSSKKIYKVKRCKDRNCYQLIVDIL